MRLKEILSNELCDLGVQDDDIREIFTTGTVLVDDTDAKLLAEVFIDRGIDFKCERSLDSLTRVTIIDLSKLSVYVEED